MLSKLEIKPRTPSPLLPTTLWKPKNPKIAQEIAAQSTLIISRIRTHASSSPTPLVGLMEQFYRGVDIVIHSTTLTAQHNQQLQAASTAAAEEDVGDGATTKTDVIDTRLISVYLWPSIKYLQYVACFVHDSVSQF
jgi:hypothetical protein